MHIERRKWSAALGAVLFCALLALPAFAGNGKIAGVVQDDSGQALPGANVFAEVGGERVGTTADDKGRYFLLNIPPGAYSVEASFIGHQTVRQTQIEVRLDLTTTVDFALKTEAIEGEAITVVAEAPLVERSLTTSRATIGRAELNNTMPVADLQDLINTTPSVFRGYIRGGRKAEAKVLVDGIDVSDTYFRAGEGLVTWNPYVDVNRTSDGEFTAVGVNASNVQSLDIIAGTFNAEYDAASAGIVNVVTREGGDELEGRLFIRRGVGGYKNAGPEVYAGLVNPEPGDDGTVDETTYFDRYSTVPRRLAGLRRRGRQGQGRGVLHFRPRASYLRRQSLHRDGAFAGRQTVAAHPFLLDHALSQRRGTLPQPAQPLAALFAQADEPAQPECQADWQRHD